MHQQFSIGPRIGTYPDSISDFQKQNPAFINPEDILLNVLTLKDHDPDIKTVRLRDNQKSVLISWAPGSIKPRSRLAARASGCVFQNEPSHSLIVGIRPRQCRSMASCRDPQSLPRCRLVQG
jgi:hypothetical protein